jgi:CubicO group peptidase (beta-lactamase class C family)
MDAAGMTSRSLLLAAGLALASPAALATASADIDLAPLAELVAASKNATGHPSGTAIVVVRDGRIVYEGYFGLADLEDGVPVTADTGFYIASSTKPLFALGVLLQEAAGRLDTGTTLQAMFPQLRFAGVDAQAIRVRDLLVHVAGIDNEPLAWACAYSGIHDPDSLAKLVAASRPDAEAPHGSFRYGNVGYNLTSLWSSRVLGRPWQQDLRDTVFVPLGMRRSSAYASDAARHGWPLAKPYSIASATPGEALYLRKADETMHAAGGVIATARDLSRLLVAELEEGRVDGQQVFPAAVIAHSQQDQAVVQDRYQDFERSGYAWGWYSGSYKGQRLLHHFGGFAGTHAHLSFMPAAGIGLVVLNNEDMMAPRLTSLVADYVYGRLLGDADTHARVAARFAELEAEVVRMQASLPARRAALLARAWQLSLPRQAYAGRYRGEALGELVVEVDDAGTLRLHWGRVASVATAMEAADTVRVEFVPNSGQSVHFTVDAGRVTGLGFAGLRFERID